MALASGTDKSGNGHNYTGIYYRYFGPIRHRRLKFLEIYRLIFIDTQVNF